MTANELPSVGRRRVADHHAPRSPVLAKTFPDRGRLAYKPVLHHLLDVAAVAASYLRLQSARLAREAALCGVQPHDYVALAAFLAGLHDLGKFTRNFQAKVEPLWPRETLGAWPGPDPGGVGHWRATSLLLQLDPFRTALTGLLPNLRTKAGLIAAIAGHHGRPPPFEDNDAAARSALRKGQCLDGACVEAARFAFEELQRLTGIQPVATLNADNAPILSWRLSGLVTLSDWVGVGRGPFPALAARCAARRILA